MSTCPTKEQFIQDIAGNIELEAGEKVKLGKLYDKIMIIKSEEEQEEEQELLLGDDAMKGYKGRNVTEQITSKIGTTVALDLNGSGKTVQRDIKSVYDKGNTLVVELDRGPRWTFNKGQDRSQTADGTTEKVKFVEIAGIGKAANELVNLGNKKDDSNWDNLEKDETYIHGDPQSMLKMLETLHEMGGNKATDEDMKYYRKLLEAMDAKFFKKMALFMKKTSQDSGGWVDGNSLHFKVSKNKMLAGNQQTEAEIYLHEVVHTMTKFARLSNTPEARAIERELEYAMAEMKKNTKWEDFLPAASMNEKLEKQIAKEMYDYVFTSENAMDEFIAHVLTNNIVKAKAQQIKVHNDKIATTLLEKVFNIFSALVDVVLGNYRFTEKNNTVFDQVFNLATQLGEINNRAEAKKREHDNLAQVANNLVNAVDAKIARKLNDLKDKWIVDDNTRLEDYPTTGSRFVKGKWLFKLIKKAAVNESYGKVLGLIASSYGIKPDGIIRNVLADFSESSAHEKAVEWIQLESDKIEGARNTLINTGKKHVLDGFKKKLNAAEERALLRTIVDLDMAILLPEAGKEKKYDNQFEMRDVKKLLTDEEYLDKQIRRAKHRLKIAGGEEYYNWYTNQATGLGYYLATGKANIAQNFNAVNIARGLASTHYHNPKGAVIREIDVIATLVGIQNTGIYERALAAQLIETERAGVLNVMQMHRGYNKEAKATLFGNNGTQMIKGYSKEIFDDTIEVQIAPMADREEMEAAGFKFRGELEGKYNDKTDQPMGLFVSASFGRNEWLRGATRLVGIGSRGTTITETKYADKGDFAGERAARDIARLDTERLKLVQKQLRGEFNKDEYDYGLAPVFNDNGDVVNYRYMMGKDAKESLLKQDTSVSEVLGRTYGAMLDKSHSKEHNKKVLKSILDNMEENWQSGVLGKDLVTEYTLISPDAHDKKIKELYAILPKEFKDAINERKDRTLAVPTSLMPMYFGYRHLSIVDLPGLKKYLPKVVVELLRLVEAMWIELVKIVKTNILLKIPKVLFTNILSNFIQSVNMGLGIVDSWKLHKESFRDIRSHIKANRELAKLKLKVTANEATAQDRDRIKMLEATLKNNPAHELMERGMYQAFQEDVEAAELRGSNRLKKMVDKKLEILPSFVRTPLQWLYLSEETAFYKAMQEILQMSDLIFRDVMNRSFKIKEKKQADGLIELPTWYLKENPGAPIRKLEGKERAKFLAEARQMNMYAVLTMAVNYNKPPSSMEAYFNRIGPLRFTSYIKRIQSVAQKTTLEHPVRSAAIAMVESFVYDFDTIQDQLFLLGKTVPLYGFGETAETVIVPPAIQLIKSFT